MRYKLFPVSAFAIFGLFGLATAPASAMENSTYGLVTKVRTAAAWQGIEVNHIQRSGQTLKVSGTDRLGRERVLMMNCQDVGNACQTRLVSRGVKFVTR